MNPSKHTKGPWVVHEDQVRAGTWDGYPICQVYAQIEDSGKRYGMGVDDANANLIAAAPELFHALEKIDRWITDSQIRGYQPTELDSHIRVLARSVLDTAKGKEA